MNSGAASNRLPVDNSVPPETDNKITFHDFGLDSRLIAAVDELKYVHPTPIQAQGIPVAMKGVDVMGLAHTGTGKTVAFALPLLNRLLATQVIGTRALIIAPTRELVEQINDVIKDLAVKTRIRTATVYGGASMNRQIEELRRKPDVVVACPGRLLDHMQRRTIDLSKIEMLVLDEADQMFDMGFLPGIRRIIAALPSEYQSMLFSATMPDSIKQLATDMMYSPVVVKAASSAATAPSISHLAYAIQPDHKIPALLTLLAGDTNDTVLIFTRTKHGAKKLAERISKEGYRASALHGNLSQNQRLAALNGFRQGKYRILVATDVAARGIDVSGIGRVINYELPETVESYIHRSGRTGRASQEGVSLALVTADDAGLVRAIERTLKSRIPRGTLEGFTSPELDRLIDTATGISPQQRRKGNGGGQRQPRQGRHGGNGGGFGGQRRGDSRGGDRRDSGRGDGDSVFAGGARQDRSHNQPRRDSDQRMGAQPGRGPTNDRAVNGNRGPRRDSNSGRPNQQMGGRSF